MYPVDVVSSIKYSRRLAALVDDGQRVLIQASGEESGPDSRHFFSFFVEKECKGRITQSFKL